MGLHVDSFVFVTIVTFFSGFVGTGLGGVIGALFNRDSSRIISLLLALAGGVMCAIVCFDLLIEAITAANEISAYGVFIVIFFVLIGVFAIYLLNFIIDRHTRKNVEHTESPTHPQTHDNVDELIHADNWVAQKKRNAGATHLFIAGVVMACAIALHNLPEGMIIGSGFAVSDDLLLGAGMTMAVLIGMHNIPEGMAVAVPLISGGMGRVKAILITACCGAPTLIGAWLGLWLGNVNAIGLSLSIGFASGAMLYVIFGELLPEAYLMYKSKLPGFAAIFGLMLGLAIIYL